jgi:hypothetical protein
MEWLYSGTTNTNPSNRSTAADHALVCAFAYGCPAEAGTGSSRFGRPKSTRSTSSNSASVRDFASARTHSAISRLRPPGRVLVAMTAMAVMTNSFSPAARTAAHQQQGATGEHHSGIVVRTFLCVRSRHAEWGHE